MKKVTEVVVATIICVALLVEFVSVINKAKECRNPKDAKAILVGYRKDAKFEHYEFNNPETKQLFQLTILYIGRIDDKRDLIKLGDTLNVQYCNGVINKGKLEQLVRNLRCVDNSSF